MQIIPGLGPKLSERALSKYSYASIVNNPYILLNIDGISFNRADIVANAFNIPKDDPRRIKALIYNLTDQSLSFGHTYTKLTSLKRTITKSIPNINTGLDFLLSCNLVIEDDRVYTKRVYENEVASAQRIKQLLTTTKPPLNPIHKENEDYFQLQFLSTFYQPHTPISVLTGGPGTGKTYVLRRLIELFKHNDRTYVCLAPTGKAARRITELTNSDAHTIHKWLLDKYRHHVDYVIVDESSMIDINVFAWLLRSCPNSAFVFIGDKDQLPPVGPGAPFKDLIASKLFTTTHLLINHRNTSSIAENAKRINLGQLRLITSDDFHIIDAGNPIDTRIKLLELAKEFGEDFQILTPQRNTTVGTEELNKILKTTFNPQKYKKFDIGDKVIQTINDYDNMIFNGYVGKIVRFDSKDVAVVDFGDVIAPTPTSNIIHGWAATIHKFQGSETSTGAVIISSAHTFMLSRNLLYTAITRFKDVCYVVCDLVALKRAILTTKDVRLSWLVNRLKG